MTDELIDNHHFSLEGTKIKYLKKGTAKYELCKDATGCPDVNTWPIKFGTKQKLGRTIPKSKNLAHHVLTVHDCVCTLSMKT
jgi:hypothetical protein